MQRLDAAQLRKVAFAATLAILLASAASCSRGKPSLASPNPEKITLYEGLPHQMYESGKLAEEKTKPTVEKGGFPFYRDPLALKDADAKALGTILANPDTFEPFGGEKKCGGFHPDYALVASSKGEEFTYLICFGCGEVTVYGSGRSETRYDLGRDARTRLEELLKPYQKNRPGPIVGP